jgi:hypothetical protein
MRVSGLAVQVVLEPQDVQGADLQLIARLAHHQQAVIARIGKLPDHVAVARGERQLQSTGLPLKRLAVQPDVPVR